MNDFYDSRWIFRIISKRFVHFVIIGIIAILASAIFSGPAFITPKYKSSARIYPSNLGEMSEESPTEQMLEILSSNDIKFKMIDAFDLGTIYKINSSDPNFRTYVLGKYNENVSVNKTEYETVRIDILDSDPNRAAIMCDSLIHFYNEKVREMHAAKHWEVVKILDNLMKEKKSELDSLELLVNKYRTEYQIISNVPLAAEVTRGYMRALADGSSGNAGTKTIRQIYQNLTEKGAEASRIEYRFTRSLRQLDSLRWVHRISLSEATKRITYCHLVENPMPADKKAYPVRWMIVAFTTLSSLFLALLAFVFLEYKKEN